MKPMLLKTALAARPQPPEPPDRPPGPPCPAARAGEFCSGGWHITGSHEEPGAALYRCPVGEAQHVQARLTAERARLAGALQRSGEGFSGYQPGRCEGGAAALRALQDFARGRPPRRSVLLVGTTGLGKSRLLLAAHFALMTAGVHSEYLTGRELGRLLQRAESFEVETRDEAERGLGRLRVAQAVLLDDAGDPAADERRRSAYVAGLQELLDTVRGAWAVALNTGEDEWLGAKVLSRILHGAEVVAMAGPDQRIGGVHG